jgi:HD-GYP domain-containing protein (c-di-GMP phosphodiesterase class II)
MAEPRLYDLLEASAQHARASARLLTRGVEEGDATASELSEVVRANASIVQEIRTHLLRADVVSLPKGEVEALAGVLAEIPADAARFIERFALATKDLATLNWKSSLSWIEELSEILCEMVRQLRGFESLDHIKELHARMLKVADHAEAHTDEIMTRLYKSPAAPLHMMMAKDLTAQLNAAIERYREAGKVLAKISFEFF